MFYACALDPEGCGVKFAMVLADMFGSDVSPPITRYFFYVKRVKIHSFHEAMNYICGMGLMYAVVKFRRIGFTALMCSFILSHL